jgi:hypothetical protein
MTGFANPATWTPFCVKYFFLGRGCPERRFQKLDQELNDVFERQRGSL